MDPDDDEATGMCRGDISLTCNARQRGSVICIFMIFARERSCSAGDGPCDGTRSAGRGTGTLCEEAFLCGAGWMDGCGWRRFL